MLYDDTSCNKQPSKFIKPPPSSRFFTVTLYEFASFFKEKIDKVQVEFENTNTPTDMTELACILSSVDSNVV